MCYSLDFHPLCFDAVKFDYSMLNLKGPAFFIGGLAQMGGVSLATGVIEKIYSIDDLQKNSGWVFAGTLSQKYTADPKGEAGWGSLLEKNNLNQFKVFCYLLLGHFTSLMRLCMYLHNYNNSNPN